MTLKSLFHILSMNEYTTQNDLHLEPKENSFYERYYKNPKKLKKLSTRKKLLFNKDSVGDNLGTVLNNVYIYSKTC